MLFRISINNNLFLDYSFCCIVFASDLTYNLLLVVFSNHYFCLVFVFWCIELYDNAVRSCQWNVDLFSICHPVDLI